MIAGEIRFMGISFDFEFVQFLRGSVKYIETLEQEGNFALYPRVGRTITRRQGTSPLLSEPSPCCSTS
jgi:hypothetical protein